MTFDYFYGPQADQFAFYRIPKVLFTDERFGAISTDAKTLYGILLDRMNLSAANGWLDQEGRLYIIFTVEEVMAALSCGNKKAVSLLAELERKAGLIERKRQGLGRPNLIYVKNFTGIYVDKSVDNHVDKPIQNCQNDTSGNVEPSFLEMSNRHGNNTDMNETDMKKTDSFHSVRAGGRDCEEMDLRRSYRDYFWEQLEYEYLVREYPYDTENLEEIMELLIDTCCTARRRIRIAGDDKPVEVVKSQFMKLTGEHIRFVISCMKENTTKIRNMKQYLLAALYNAPLTISNYYSSRVNYDMANVSIRGEDDHGE